MKINGNNLNSQSFGSIYNNKAVLKGLEKISEHGASFIAGTSLAMASIVRPAAIALTPDVKKENKEYAITNSITSGLIKFAMVEAVALPVENAIKKIDKNPSEFLSKKTINTLKAGAKDLTKSNNYKFASQLLKLSTGLITAIPKSIMTVALIPVFMDFLFNKTSKNKIKTPQHENKYNNIFSNDFNTNNKTSFKGSLSNYTAKGIGKILNNDSFQKFAIKHSSNNQDIARNMTIATDALLSLSFAHRTFKNKEIASQRKKPLVYNNLISTGISISAGYGIDKIIKNSTKNITEKFAQIHKNNPKLGKYIDGINILRPTLIFAAVYYGIIPFISTYLAERAAEKTTKEKKQ